MRRSLAILCGFAALAAACASDPTPNTPAAQTGVERAGPPPVETAPAPSGVASGVTVPVEAPPPPPADDEVVVPGVVEEPVAPPPGDVRSAAQRMRDIRAWDRCVLRMQARTEDQPSRPTLETPEEICSRQLRMSSRTAVPEPAPRY
jgi:hypothetical protein